MGTASSRTSHRYFVVLDTNMVMLAVAEGIDVFDELERVLEVPHEYVMLRSSIDELERLIREKGPKVRRQALLALEIAKSRCKVVDDSSIPGLGVDEKIINFALANRGRVVVATNDTRLRKRLRELSIPTVYFRAERKGLEIDTELY